MTDSFILNPQLDGKPFFLEGTGKDAILLLHGFTSTPQEVNRLGRVLHRIGYTVAGPMLPGHGTKPADLNRTTRRDWVDSVEAAYLDLAKRCRRVFVGGESTGGLLALSLALRHPEVAGILAYSPALRLRINRPRVLILPLLALIKPLREKGDLTGNTTWQGYKVNPLKAVLHLYRLGREVEPRLGEIRQPILIVQGRNDFTIDPQSSQVIYEKVASPIKQLHWMEKSGHCVLLDGEQHEVTRLTMDFLFRIPAGK